MTGTALVIMTVKGEDDFMRPNDPISATAATTRRGDWNSSAMPPFAAARYGVLFAIDRAGLIGVRRFRVHAVYGVNSIVA